MKPLLLLLNFLISSHILYSQDIWVNKNLNPNYAFNKIKFINDSTGFLLELETFLKTTDGGKNWSEVLSLEMFDSNTFVTFDMFENGSGLILRAGRKYSKTTDFGESWTNYDISSDYLFHKLYAIDKNNFWIMSFTNKHLLFTTDGGQTWDSVSSNSFQDVTYLTNIYFKNSTVGIITSDNGNIYQTSDGGKSWSLTPTGSSEYLQGIYFIDDNYGWIAGALGTILHTSDGGVSWGKLPFPSNDNTVAIYFVSRNDGWVTTTFERDGKIYYTSDGGNNWVLQHHEVPTTSSHFLITSLFFLNKNKGWAAGYSGRVLIYDKTSSVYGDISTEVFIYPNPTHEMLHILTDVLISSVELSDLLGNVVLRDLSPTISNGEGVSINVEGLPAGMYFLKLYTMRGEVLVEKVIVGF
jgi:photosystem II stability/assembly factor-like uncharacterized protein